MVLILLAFIALCLWRNRQQSSMHKYDPPRYLCQPGEMNGHILDYSALGAFAHGGARVPGGCPHLHHKLPNGLTLLNGSGGGFPAAHAHEHDGEHPHHHLNGGNLYTALPQTESPDCMSCQNLCNNNRCYKANGTLLLRASPCRPDGLEMVPLGQVPPPGQPPPPRAGAPPPRAPTRRRSQSIRSPPPPAA
ncbi:cell adhesion molecule-related/down-regulated by oncogenes [Menidia menidia]